MKATVLALLVAGVAPAPSAAQAPLASPNRTEERPTTTGPEEVSDGRDVVRAMHARYDGRWYRDFMLVQDVTYYRDGGEERTERMAEYISLPGRVRAITGDIRDGNADIYVDGAFHRFEGGRPAGRVASVHGVLVTGFDVYAYVDFRTLDTLDPALFDVVDLKTTGPLP